MNRLTKTAYIIAIAYLIAGFVMGGVMQGELLNVGVQYFEPHEFFNLTKLHTNCLFFGVPIALGAAAISDSKFMGESRKWILRWLSVLCLASTVLPFAFSGFSVSGWILLIPAGAMLVAIACRFSKLFRAVPIVYIICTGLTGLLVVGMWAVVQNANLYETMRDTYTVLAILHGVGIVGLGFVFATFAAVCFDNNRPKFAWVFIVHALMLNLAGFLFVMWQVRLGTYGMPRGYLDYPAEFQHNIGLASFAGLALMCLTVLIALVFTVNIIRHRNKDADVFE